MPATVGQMQDYASQVANQYGIPNNIFQNVVSTESSWNPNAVSSKGAIGLGQLMPGTAANLGVNPYDWQQNLQGTGQYLSQLYNKFGNWVDAVAAYNAGPGRIQSVLNGNSTLPTETQNYVQKVFGDSLGQGSFSSALSNFLTGGNAANGGLQPTDIKLPNPLSWMQAIANFFSMNTAARLGAFGIGLVFLIAAVFVLVSGSKTVREVVSNGKDAALAAM